jgi:hypothetical protein
MSKINLAEKVELQSLKKENSTLKGELEDAEKSNISLKEKIKALEESFKNNPDSQESLTKNLKIAEIKLTSNIRDEYDIEEIAQLAIDIYQHGQLQPVLLTKDNYLIAGYRRYNAFLLLNDKKQSSQFDKKKVPKFIIGYKLNTKFHELNQEQIDELQYSENEIRKSLDNFQISKLFNKYVERGYDQKYICEKFNKNIGFVSALVSLRNIDLPIVTWLKEFQIYSWSKNRFTVVKNNGFDRAEASYYERNRGIIGWKALYEISKQLNITDQKKTFLKFYRNRLSEEELNSEYFYEIDNDKQKKHDQIISAHKQTNGLFKIIKHLEEDSPETIEITKEINKRIKEIQDLLELLSQLPNS